MSSPEILQHIRIAKVQVCRNDPCPFSQHPHLNIDYDNVELSNTKALAISYTWGEFDREKVKIGHDVSGQVVEMELGKEWDVQETIERLAMICKENSDEHGPEHAGVWIDQLCIHQTDDAKVRATLASIPTIYRTLDVVILMPGGICRCLQEAHAKITASPKVSRLFQPGKGTKHSADLGEFSSDDDRLSEILNAILMSHKILDCANAFGACSYFDRVWTRQELLYSNSVRVVRTRVDEMQCARSPADARHLSSFPDKLYRRLLKIHPEKIAFHTMTKDSWELWSKVKEGLLNFGSPRTRETREMFDLHHAMQTLTVLDFLLGQKVKKLIPRGVDLPVWFRLQQFLAQIQFLGTSPRKATKAYDYVAAVWVDCPGYILPENYTKMSLPGLLDDGMHQLESKHRISIRVSCLAGFFGFSSIGSALWRPTVYLGGRKIERVSDVYQTILSAMPIPIIPSGEIPLKLTPLPRTTFSQLAKEYSELFSNSPITDVVDKLGSIIENWAWWCVQRIRNRVKEYEALSRTPIRDPRLRFLTKLYLMAWSHKSHTPSDREKLVNTAATIFNGSENLDHYPVVYDLIAVVLGLDVSDCQNCGLKLMVVPGKCIGFTAPVLKSETGWEQVITISTGHFDGFQIAEEAHGAEEHDWVTLEAVKVADHPVPRYRAAGIWVPHNISNLQVGANVNKDDYDALLE